MSQPAAAPKKITKTKRYLRWLAVVVVCAACCNPCTLAVGVRIGAVEPFEMEGPSMLPNIQDGDRMIVSKFRFGLFFPFTDEAAWSWGGPDVGDVVILHTVTEHIDVVKRVVGLPGDTIAFRGGALVRNGRPVARRTLRTAAFDGEEMHCVEETVGTSRHVVLEATASVPFEAAVLVIPTDHYYLLGDNRDRSNDSRFTGPVARAQLKGRVESIYFHGPEPLSCADDAEHAPPR